jgi:sulfur carrier protein
MEITVIYQKEEFKKEIKENITIKEALDLMNIPSESVVVKRNNEVVMDEEKIHDKDLIEVIRIIYGG